MIDNDGVIFELKDGSTIRLMNPVTRHANPSLNYPSGYVRKYNSSGQPLDINGNYPNNVSKVGFQEKTYFHITD